MSYPQVLAMTSNVQNMHFPPPPAYHVVSVQSVQLPPPYTFHSSQNLYNNMSPQLLMQNPSIYTQQIYPQPHQYIQSLAQPSTNPSYTARPAPVYSSNYIPEYNHNVSSTAVTKPKKVYI